MEEASSWIISKAFLQVIRDPTERMVEAAVNTPLPNEADNRPLWLAIWQNMIDAAISEIDS